MLDEATLTLFMLRGARARALLCQSNDTFMALFHKLVPANYPLSPLTDANINQFADCCFHDRKRQWPQYYNKRYRHDLDPAVRVIVGELFDRVTMRWIPEAVFTRISNVRVVFLDGVPPLINGALYFVIAQIAIASKPAYSANRTLFHIFRMEISRQMAFFLPDNSLAVSDRFHRQAYLKRLVFSISKLLLRTGLWTKNWQNQLLFS